MATTFNQSQNEEVQVMLKLENLLAAGDLVIQQQIKQLGQNLTSGIVYKLVTDNSLKLEKISKNFIWKCSFEGHCAKWQALLCVYERTHPLLMCVEIIEKSCSYWWVPRYNEQKQYTVTISTGQ